jgi:aspartate racemase
MKRLGIVGGIGPESTIVYYRSLMAAGRERLVGAALPLLINSIDVRMVLRLAEEDPVPGLRDYLLSEISVLARGGASVGLD